MRRHTDGALFAAFVPDEPAWVDVRGALLCGRSTVLSHGRPDSFVIATPHIPLVCVVGRPEPDLITIGVALAAGDGDAPPVLAVEDATAALVARALPDWSRDTAILHIRRGALPPTPHDRDVRWSEPQRPLADTLLATVDERLRDEILDAARTESVAYATVEGQAVAFCYAPWRTERWFDISVDTAPAWRRRGLGLACARALIARHEAGGIGAVWGAHEGNAASRGLAARLGFCPVARISVFERTG